MQPTEQELGNLL